jgi:FAD:protein FMN transferase
MRSSSPLLPSERARPLLGTRVAIRVAGLRDDCAHRAIDAAFDAIASIHALMSFHATESDVSRLNRDAFDHPVAVHPSTYEVLRWSQQIAADSGACFDITAAAQLVAWGILPAPTLRHRPDPSGSSLDIELLPNDRIRFHRRVWIDLGGIAKGFAVDRAIEVLAAHGAAQACVNAGGDLRILGSAAEPVRLRTATDGDRVVPVIAIENGSVASSGGPLARQRAQGRLRGPHVHGQWRRGISSDRFACVIAERCLIADALTKIVLAQGCRSESMLRRYGATAHLYTTRRGWRSMGVDACDIG